jgi:hypothetical protein
MTMRSEQFLNAVNWSGGFYQLGIELTHSHDDVRLRAALEAIWSCSSLVGPWLERESIGTPTVRPDLPQLPIDPDYGMSRLYGVLSVTGGSSLGCLVSTTRVQDGPDWIYVSIPMGMLEAAFRVQYPLSIASNRWLPQVQRALVVIAYTVFAVVPFDLGIVGFEISSLASESNRTRDVIAKGGFLLSERLCRSFDLDPTVEDLGSGLKWIPPEESLVEFDFGDPEPGSRP